MSWRNKHLRVLRETYLLDEATDEERARFFKLSDPEAVALLRSRCGCSACKRPAVGGDYTPHPRGMFSNLVGASVTRSRISDGRVERAARRNRPD